MGTKLLKQKI